jgi:hypothetical protein
MRDPGRLFAVNCTQQASTGEQLHSGSQLGAAFALLSSEDLAPIKIDQPKSDRSRWFWADKKPRPSLVGAASDRTPSFSVCTFAVELGPHHGTQRDGTLRVLKASRDEGVKRVVMTSSISAIIVGREFVRSPLQRRIGLTRRTAATHPPMIGRKRLPSAQRGHGTNRRRGARTCHCRHQPILAQAFGFRNQELISL